MATPAILSSKLTPPAPPSAWLPRTRLLGGALPGPVTLLQGGPGTGKSLALLALAERLQGPGGLLAWYTFDAYDADPVSLFQHLLEHMRQTIPEFARELDQLPGAPDPEPARLWRGFFMAIAAYNLPSFVLVMDDMQHLAASHPDWVQALGPFLANLPPRTHVLIATRSKLPLPLARLKAAGRLAFLDGAALRFDGAEVEAYLAARAATAASRERAMALDGWPLGLQLATAGGLLDAGGLTGGDLTAYIGEELYQTRPADEQAFMRRAACLAELTAGACDAALEATGSGAMLARLAEEQLLVPLAGHERYRWPAFLQAFLLAEVPLPEAERRAIHGRAAAYHHARGEAELAMPHWLGAEDWAGAEAEAREGFPALAAAGRYEPIERWLAAVPPEAVDASGQFQLWSGHCLARRGENAAALVRLEAARRRFAEADEPAFQLRALVRQCMILAYAEDARPLNTKLVQAIALLPHGHAGDRADLHIVRVLVADQRGDFAVMREAAEAILDVAGDGLDVVSAHWIARVNLYTLALHEGDLAAAAAHARSAVEVAEPHFATYALFARFLLADLQLLADEPEAAMAFLRALPAGWEDTLEWHDRGCALAIVGHAHHLKGDWREAEEALMRSRAVFERAGYKLALKVPLERQAWLAIHRGQPARVLALCEGLEPGGSHYDLALELALARAEHLLGRHEQAWARWSSLVERLDAQRANLLAVQARLFAAATLQELGREPEARAMLAAAEEGIARHGYGFLRRREPALWQALAGLAPPAPAPAGTLEVRLFGGFEARLDGRLLDRWPRKRAKRVLAAIALTPRGTDGAGLAAALEEPPGDARVAAVHTAVVALRRVLEPELGKGDASRYVVSAGAGYRLADGPLGFVDVRAFAEAMARGRSLAAGDPVAAAAAFEEAMACYRGNLLEEPLFAGCFDVERRHAQREALDALAFLHAFHRDRGDRSSAERALRRAIVLSPCEEEPYVALIRFFVDGGQRERVRQVYWDFRKALKAHLGIAPDEAFEATYRALAGTGVAPRNAG